jgi:hypothetical protein
MFEIDEMLELGVFNQLVPVWHVLFFIASLLPFLLRNRVKICLLITYLFTYYLGFMVIFGEHIANSGSMQPFVLYALSGVGIAVVFVATIFTEEGSESTGVRGRRSGRLAADEQRSKPERPDSVELAVNIANVSERQGR